MMERAEIEQQYREEFRPRYEKFAAYLHQLLAELINKTKLPVDKIEARTKTVESFLEKVTRKAYQNPLTDIKDCAGIRIITYYQDDVERLKTLIYREFTVDAAHSEDKIARLDAAEFGYRSVHFVVTLAPPRSALNELEDFAGLPAEIQVRTILQHAWARMSHEFDYKSQSQVPDELRRRLFRLSALLELADEEFLTLRDRAAGISAGYRTEMAQGQLNLPLDLASLRAFLEQQVDLAQWERFGVQAGMEPFPQIISKFHAVGLEILLLTLQTAGVTAIAEFERLLPGFAEMAESVRRFVAAVKSAGGLVHAVPVDVLTLLASFAKARALPPDFDWGGKYEPFFIETLRQAVSWQRMPENTD